MSRRVEVWSLSHHQTTLVCRDHGPLARNRLAAPFCHRATQGPDNLPKWDSWLLDVMTHERGSRATASTNSCAHRRRTPKRRRDSDNSSERPLAFSGGVANGRSLTTCVGCSKLWFIAHTTLSCPGTTHLGRGMERRCLVPGRQQLEWCWRGVRSNEYMPVFR